MFGFLKRRNRDGAATSDSTSQAAPSAGPLSTSGGPRSGGESPGKPSPSGGLLPASAATGSEALLRRLEWTVVRRLDGLLQGDYRTLFRGHGFDLADLREYQPTDDVRFIDWNVTARLTVPHVREHQEDREVAIWMLVDLSGSVGFGSAEVSKRMLATEFCAVMARLLSGRGNRVGARLLTDGRRGIEVLAPATGRRHVLHLMERIRSTRSGSGDAAATDLGRLLADAQRGIRRRSSIFVLSDFISQPGWEHALALLAQRHDVVAVRLFDPLELALPDLGLIALRDAETDELIWIDSGDQRFRERFERLADDNEARLRAALAKAGVDCLELSTGEPLADSLVRFVRLRKRRSQLSAGAASALAGTTGGVSA
jgi:uncharacterized protein (DUF58 family)